MDYNDIEQLIKELNDKLEKQITKLGTLQGKINSLKSQSSLDQSTIYKQKNTLKDFEKKLFECSKDRDEIQVKLDKKVAELESSNFSREEIVKQVTQLLTKSDFIKVREKVIGVWSDYAKTKENFVQLLESKVSREQEAIKRFDKAMQNLWIAIYVLIVIVILLSLSLSLSLLLLYKKKKNQNKPFFLKRKNQRKFSLNLKNF